MSEIEEPRKKRKYTKRAKMLLRSNNDYIDHTYWPKIYAQSKKRHEAMMKKYGVGAKNLAPHVWSDVEKEALRKQGIGKVHAIHEVLDKPLTTIPVITDN